MTQEQNPKDAPGGNEQAPTTPTTPPVTTSDTQPKVEIKDGVVMVDGKKYVKESDLIAAKEGLQGRLDEAQTVHNEAVDKLNLQVSDAQQEVAKANAALEEANKARSAGDTSAEEVSRIKTEAEEAKTKLTALTISSLDYRRKYLMATYNIPVDSETAQKLADKDMAQLDSFEEALKALVTSQGPGNYAIGGGGGGATPMTEDERAKAILANTPVRGVRTPATAE